MTDTAAAAPKKLFLLDAFALIYRSHFAFSKNPRINSKGMNTGAVLGFTNTLVEVLQKEKPTHIGVCFDGPKKTFRHEQFAAYKAQRQAMPEDIGIAIPYIKKIIQGFHIPILMLDGFEADDVIGTLAQKAEAGRLRGVHDDARQGLLPAGDGKHQNLPARLHGQRGRDSGRGPRAGPLRDRARGAGD